MVKPGTIVRIKSDLGNPELVAGRLAVVMHTFNDDVSTLVFLDDKDPKLFFALRHKFEIIANIFEMIDGFQKESLKDDKHVV